MDNSGSATSGAVVARIMHGSATHIGSRLATDRQRDRQMNVVII